MAVGIPAGTFMTCRVCAIATPPDYLPSPAIAAPGNTRKAGCTIATVGRIKEGNKRQRGAVGCRA